MSLLFSQALLAGLTGSLSEEAIEERLAPTGRILVDGAVKPKVKTADKNSPAHIYKTKCAVCHANGIAKAPRFQVAKDWESRLAKKKLEGIWKSAIRGIKAMPPRGNCFKCTDEQLLDTIKYMIDEQ